VPHPIFIAFREPEAQANQLRKSSSAASQLSKLNKINSVRRMRLNAWLSI
jgi:hypothetical protein